MRFYIFCGGGEYRQAVRRIRKYKSAATVALATVASANVQSASGFTFPGDPALGCAYARNINWYFSGSGWTPARQNATRTGFSNWNRLSDETSVRYIRSTEQTSAIHSANAFAVIRQAGGDARAACAEHQIRLGNDVIDSDVARTMAHEMGHAHGLSHGGYQDTLQTGKSLLGGLYADAGSANVQPGRTELMAGCGRAASSGPTPDDWSEMYTL